jgi:hypothetical protein
MDKWPGSRYFSASSLLRRRRHLARRDQLSDNRRIGLQTLNPMKLLFEADERCYFGQSRCHI